MVLRITSRKVTIKVGTNKAGYDRDEVHEPREDESLADLLERLAQRERDEFPDGA